MTRMKQGVVWSFETAKLRVVLQVDRNRHYKYDGDDESGEVQDKLNSGEYVAFGSTVIVTLKATGKEIGFDYLGGSVYGMDNYAEFWTAHRDPDASNRNTLAMRAQNRAVGHYFPDMVKQALRNARREINSTVAALPVVKLAPPPVSQEVSIASHGDLFVIPSGPDGSFSCLGFDVALQRTAQYAATLNRPDLAPVAPRGSLESYAEYIRAERASHQH